MRSPLHVHAQFLTLADATQSRPCEPGLRALRLRAKDLEAELALRRAAARHSATKEDGGAEAAELDELVAHSRRELKMLLEHIADLEHLHALAARVMVSIISRRSDGDIDPADADDMLERCREWRDVLELAGAPTPCPLPRDEGRYEDVCVEPPADAMATALRLHEWSAAATLLVEDTTGDALAVADRAFAAACTRGLLPLARALAHKVGYRGMRSEHAALALQGCHWATLAWLQAEGIDGAGGATELDLRDGVLFAGPPPLPLASSSIRSGRTGAGLSSSVACGGAVAAAGLPALAHVLRTEPCLKSLVLDKTPLGSGGVALLAAAIASAGRSTLSSLSLAHCQIGDAGACAIAQMLRTNRSLRTLSLRDNRIGDRGGAALALALSLSRNRALRSLNLWCNDICEDVQGDLERAWGARDGLWVGYGAGSQCPKGVAWPSRWGARIKENAAAAAVARQKLPARRPARSPQWAGAGA